jgi:PAS domain S-box-containing protein
LIIIYIQTAADYGAEENNWQNKKAKESLLESERRFTEMLKNVNLISVILDVNGKVTFCNQYFLDVSGYTEAEVIGSNWFDNFTPHEIRGDIRVVFQRFIKGEIFFPHYENEILVKNNKRLLFSWNNTLLRSTEGEIIGTASIGENITVRKAAEEQKLQFANILEASLNEIYVFDAETLLFKYVNYGALNNLGYSPEKILTLKLPDIQPEFNQDAFRKQIHPLNTMNPSDHESINHIDGSYILLRFTALFEYSSKIFWQ